MQKKREKIRTGCLAGIVLLLLAAVCLLFCNLQSEESRNNEKSNQYIQNQAQTKEENEQEITEERDTVQNIGKEERVELKEEEQADAAEKNTEEADAAEKNTEEADAAEKNMEETDTAEKSTEEAETEQKDTELKWTVAIDPGHQGSWVDMSEKEPNGPGSTEMKAMATTGTQGKYSGKPEYELNLEVSLLLRDELEKRGYRVILTREDNDKAISNAQRAEYAYEEGGDIYVRIHANGSDRSGVNGALAMVPSPSNPYVGELAEASYRLAEAILNAYCERASFSSLGIQYYDNMTGINWSKLPVMILEMGFMTNQTDDLRMADPEIQRLMAEGIADGIDQYFTEVTGIELEK